MERRVDRAGWRLLVPIALLCACSGEEALQSDDGTRGPSQSRSAEPNRAEDGTQPFVFERHDFADPGMNGQIATSILAPEGWQVEGGIQRPSNQLYRIPVLADVNVTAPDGRGVHFFPSLNFSYGPDVGSPTMGPVGPMEPTQHGNPYLWPPQSIGQWSLELAQNNPDPRVQNLRLISEQPLEPLRQTLLQQQASAIRLIEQQNAQFASLGVRTDFDLQATQLVFRYLRDGRDIEETVLVVWQGWANSTNGQVRQGRWSIDTMQSMRGPAGSDYLNDPQLAAIVQSVQVNPVWAQEMQRYWNELARIEQRGHNERMRQNQIAQQRLSQTYSEINDIVAGGWKARSAIQDRGHERSIDAIWDQTAYSTSSGSTVKLPSFYDHVYTDGDGRYILHNDNLWNPNRDQRFNARDWTRIEPVP